MLDQYIQTYGRRLYGLCLHLCADRLDAEDLYQEVWLKVMKNLSKYDEEQKFEPWLTRICVNTYRNMLRKRRRSPFRERFASGEEKDALLDSVKAPESPDYAELYEAIGKLPEKLRVTVLLYYFEDMDIRSAAQALGIPEGTVKSRLNQARKRLKEVLVYG